MTFIKEIKFGNKMCKNMDMNMKRHYVLNECTAAEYTNTRGLARTSDATVIIPC